MSGVHRDPETNTLTWRDVDGGYLRVGYDIGDACCAATVHVAGHRIALCDLPYVESALRSFRQALEASRQLRREEETTRRRYRC